MSQVHGANDGAVHPSDLRGCLSSATTTTAAAGAKEDQRGAEQVTPAEVNCV